MILPTLDINTCYTSSKYSLNAIIEHMLPYWQTNILPTYISAQCKLGPFTSNEYNQFV
jgi:bisphosphoglycerate-dependent phosphoglycerate mutase